jgi:hypothetical protein
MAKLNECTALTIILDIWSSKNMLGLIGFSCQGVSSSFKPFNMFFDLNQMKGSYTAQFGNSFICKIQFSRIF